MYLKRWIKGSEALGDHVESLMTHLMSCAMSARPHAKKPVTKGMKTYGDTELKVLHLRKLRNFEPTRRDSSAYMGRNGGGAGRTQN